MKRLLYILSLIVFAAFVGCENYTEQQLLGEGCLVMNVQFNETSKSSSADEILDNSILRIYNSEGGLLRKYSPASEAPSEIYLASGSYYAEIIYEQDTRFTTDITELSYYGKTEFEIVAGELNEIFVNCTPKNSLINVKFNESIATNFGTNFSYYITLSDSFSKDDVDDDSVEWLSFEADDSFYFLPKQESKTLSWGFYGNSSNVLIGDLGYVEASGSLEISESSEYTLNLTYSTTPDGGLQINIIFNPDPEIFTDGLIFSPQPIIIGSDFSISDTYAIIQNQDAINFSVSGIKEISSISISNNNNSYNILENSTDQGVAGVSYTVSTSTMGTLSMSYEFFEQIEAGEQELKFYIVDVEGTSSTTNMDVLNPGVYSTPIHDLWYNSATFEACYTGSSDNIKIEYKNSLTEDWTQLSTTVNGTYVSANIASAEWEQNYVSLNSKSLYTVKDNTGIFANNSYDFRLLVDDAVYSSSSFTTGTGDTIPDSDFESSSLLCWGQSSSSADTWASGNTSFGKADLCSQSTYTGMSGKCAKLTSTEAGTMSIYFFAGGNICYGRFAQSGLSGTMSFGQPYSWTTRPKTFKFKYAATIGTVTDNEHSGPLSKGDSDKGRVFMAIVDWSSRHGVTSGSSGYSGSWDPENSSTVSVGNIIGYASLYITESAEDVQEIELPIKYYDNVTKPSSSIGLVISGASSAYGEYMNGSQSSRLYLDDMEFGY